MPLLSTDDCSRGCWQGLYPGETTEVEVKNFFEGLDSYSDGDLRRWGGTGIWIPYHFYSGLISSSKDQFLAEAQVEDELLISFRLWGPFNLTLAQLLEHYGEPELVSSSVGPYGETMYAQIGLQLHYPEYGFTYLVWYWDSLRDNDHLEICIQPDDVVYQISVYEPASLTQYISQDINLADERADIWSNWSAFDCYIVP